MTRLGAIIIWVALLMLIAVAILLAANSPLLAWREPMYIVAGFAGVLAMAVLLLQPLLANKQFAGLPALSAQRFHRWNGLLLVLLVVVHVIGLWITSPPDVIDALLFRSATQFSVWGVLAMWCVFITAIFALFRRRLKIRPNTWKLIHLVLAIVIVVCSVVHALLIDGTMEIFSKSLLAISVLGLTALTIFKLLPPVVRQRKKRRS